MMASGWGEKIGLFAKAKKAEASDVDKHLLKDATSQRYGYDQPSDSLFTSDKERIYQSYDQERTPEGESSTSAEEQSPTHEVKDNYDAIDAESDSEEDRNNRQDDKKDDSPQPLTKKTVIELLICILAFVGRGFCLNSVGPTLIDLRQIASISISTSAWIFVSQSLGFLMGSLLAKIILQRFNNELALAACLALQAICTALIPAFHSIYIMCFMFVGQGFAIGVVGIGVCSTCIRLGGKTRNGMFLQSVYLGVSIGSVLGPFIARPFLSNLARHTDNQVDTTLVNKKSDIQVQTSTQPHLTASSAIFLSNDTNATTHIDSDDSFTTTHVHFYYVIIGLVLSIASIAFFTLYLHRDESDSHRKEDEYSSEPLSLKDWTIPLTAAIVLLFLLCLLYFGTQDTYSNLLTTFAVLGPLQMSKTRGVYVSSIFWASMCFGRLNGIWIAKLLSPFKMLLIDMTAAVTASIVLMSFSAKYSAVLWIFTAILGLSFATINGATVSWAAAHLPGNNYILSIIMVGRCGGLLLLPTTVTALFRVCGAMTLMYALFFASSFMLMALVFAQILAQKFGVQGKLSTKSEMIRKKNADDNDR